MRPLILGVCNRNLTWSDLNCKGVDGSSTSLAGEALLVINLQTIFKTGSISTFIPFEICEFTINKNNSTYFMQLICVMNNIYYDVILSQYICCDSITVTSSLISLFSASYTAPPQRTQPWWKTSNNWWRWSPRYNSPFEPKIQTRPLCLSSALMRFLLIVIFPATRL